MKVLLVEDDPSSRLYLESLLEINNISVRVAENGIDGLNVFDEYLPDIVITDIQMPLMDGIELLETIKQKKPETVVIITTAFGSERYAIQALRLGASNYLKKPVTGNDLIPILRKYNKILFDKPQKFDECGKITNRTFRLEFQARMDNIPQIVDKLMSETGYLFTDRIRFDMEMGLVELITNAIEHGCYEITYSEKRKALESNTLEMIYAEKLNSLQYQNLKIIVEYTYETDFSTWTIIDNGKGFEYKNLPDPTNDENLEQLSGRGIFITGFLFDERTYSGRGNVVTVKKYHKAQPETVSE